MSTTFEQDGPTLGVAVIGCGYWGINYLRILRELPHVPYLAAVDSRPHRLKEMSGRFPNLRLYEAADQALADPSINAVVIATPASTHFDLVRRCLEISKPVLVEKPITTTAEQASKLVQLAERLDIPLAVGHTFLYNGALQKVKSYIETGELGVPYYVYTRRTNLGPVRQDVNALWDLATHDVSIVHYLLGSAPSWVSAVGTNVLRSGVADVGFVVLGYPNETIAHIHVSWADPNKVREVVVVGSQQRIVFDDLKIGEEVRVYEKGITPLDEREAEALGPNLLIRDGDIISPRIEPSEPLKNQCLDFLECVQSGRRPMSDGYMGLAVVEVLEAIDRSLASRGAPVAVPVTETRTLRHEVGQPQPVAT